MPLVKAVLSITQFYTISLLNSVMADSVKVSIFLFFLLVSRFVEIRHSIKTTVTALFVAQTLH